jgi:hypothetical protein
MIEASVPREGPDAIGSSRQNRFGSPFFSLHDLLGFFELWFLPLTVGTANFNHFGSSSRSINEFVKIGAARAVGYKARSFAHVIVTIK